jgi:hypothetical protein
MRFLLQKAKATGEKVTVLDNPYASADLVIEFIIQRRNQRIDDGVIKGRKRG